MIGLRYHIIGLKYNILGLRNDDIMGLRYRTATPCNTLQHPATHCNTLGPTY